MKRLLIMAGSLILLAVFIYFMMREPAMSGIAPDALEERLIETGILPEGKADSGLLLRRNYSFEAEDFDGCFYYPPQDFMDVDEILVVRSDDPAVLKEVRAAADARLSTQKTTFENYGTYQFQRLSNAVIYEKGGYFILIVDENPEAVLRSIRKEIES